jgi:dihydrofolate reductase
VVITRDRAWHAEDAEVAHSADDALRIAADEPVSVIGGAEIFALFLPLADRIELTEVLADIRGNTTMPDPRDSAEWRETLLEQHEAEAESPAFRFVRLDHGVAQQVRSKI